MDVTSTYKNARISARKARDVAREIQGLSASSALDLLNFTPRKGARLFAKTLKTALADAENNFELSLDRLYVKSAVVGEGATLKRFKPRARGSAGPIRRRTSHLRIVVADAEPIVDEVKTSRKGAARGEEARQENSDASGETRLDEKLGMVYDSPPSQKGDLNQISGLTKKHVARLNTAGIYLVQQVADWSESNIDSVAALLEIEDRGVVEGWATQAKELMTSSEVE